MRISEVSKKTGLSVSNIRFYEKKGLLTPNREDESKYRDYSPQDMEQLEKIILYRKLNIPVETIHAMQNGHTSFSEVLEKQKKELCTQKEMLEASIELCQQILNDPDIENINVDYYLNYVKEEELRGRHFGRLEEMIDELTEFSRNSLLGGILNEWSIFQNVWAVRVVSLLWLVLWIGIPASGLFNSYQKYGTIPTDIMFFWGAWFLCLSLGFLGFIRRR